MIKCPKCGFSQPEDIYCASCGIKMDGYAKKKGSGLATNWMVHVCILIILIISFVLYDKISSRKPKPQQAVIPSANNRNTEARIQNPSPAERPQAKSLPEAEDETPVETVSAPAVAAAPEPAAPPANARADKKEQPGIQVSFYRISKQGLNDLQKISQAINISGSSVGGILGSARIAQLVSGGEMQYISGNRYKDFDDKHPTMIFKGQRHSEAARNMGLYFQVTSLRKSENAHLVEVKGWGALKVNEPDDSYFTGEMTLTPRTAAYVAGFLPRSVTYTEDEKQLFESDRVLKTINEEGFSEGSIDIIMFIEFAKSN